MLIHSLLLDALHAFTSSISLSWSSRRSLLQVILIGVRLQIEVRLIKLSQVIFLASLDAPVGLLCPSDQAILHQPTVECLQ